MENQEEYNNLSNVDKQKLHFADAASQWSKVEDLIPDKVKAAFKHAEGTLGINLAQLAFYSENWNKSKLQKYLSEKVRAKLEI